MRKLERGCVVACVAVLAACGSGNSLSGLGPFGGIPLGLGYGGGSAAGIGGFGVGVGWAYMFDGFILNSGSCTRDGSCGVGGAVTAFGTLSNGGAGFNVVLTQNVFDLANNGAAADVVKSGIETLDITLPAAGTYRALRLSFDYAFAASRPAAPGDSAVVRVQAGATSADVLRLAATDLGASIPARAGGCGSFTAPSDAVLAQAPTYAQCSDWISTQVDVTGFQGRSVRVQFIAFEGDADRNAGTDHPVALLFRNVTLAGAQ